MNCGIYQIRNILDGKRYVGSAHDFHKRWIEHKSSLIRNCHYNIFLQRAWNKHGKESFVFEIIEKCKKTDCISKEQQYLDTGLYEYNTTRIAGGGALFKNKKHTKKSKLKISKSIKEKWNDETYRNKVSTSLKKRYENVENHPNYGKHHTEEAKQKMRAAKIGEKNVWFNRSHTEEAKQKMRNARSNYWSKIKAIGE